MPYLKRIITVTVFTIIILLVEYIISVFLLLTIPGIHPKSRTMKDLGEKTYILSRATKGKVIPD